MRTKMPAGRYLHGAHGAPYFDNTLNLLALRLTLFVAEGEDYFLAFLPADKRQAIRDDWYQGIRKSNRDDEGAISWLSKEFVTGYKNNNPQLELYQQFERYLGSLTGDGDYINRCANENCSRR